MKNIPWLLIDKYLKGHLTNRDQEDLEVWSRSEPENPLFLKEIEADFQNGISFPGDFVSDKPSSWQKIVSKINVVEHSVFSRKLVFRSVAAVLIPFLLVGFGAGWYLQKKVQYSSDSFAFTTIISPRGQRTQVILPDNSKVWLNSNTTIKYPSNFNQNDRKVFIDGEAYFDVTHDQSKPFIVNTSSFNIKVYGTTFNVSAYKEDNLIETTLVKGKISITGLNIKGKKAREIILQPNESFKYFKNEQIVESKMKNEMKHLTSSGISKTNPALTEQPIIPKAMVLQHVNVEPIIGWKEGKLYFENETFENLAIKFELRYDVKIHFEDSRVGNLKYTGVFEKENINQALDALKLTTPFEYKMNLKDIYISYKK